MFTKTHKPNFHSTNTISLRYSRCNSKGLLLYPYILLSAYNENLLDISLFKANFTVIINTFISFSNSNLDISQEIPFIYYKKCGLSFYLLSKVFTILDILIASVLIKQVPLHVHLPQLCVSCCDSLVDQK